MFVDIGNHDPISVTNTLLPNRIVYMFGRQHPRIGSASFQGSRGHVRTRLSVFTRSIIGMIIQDEKSIYPGLIVAEEELQHSSVVPTYGM